MSLNHWGLLLIALAAGTVASTAKAGFEGTYQDEKLALQVAPAPGGYSGTMQLRGQTFPIAAREQGGRLVGSFVSDGVTFDFSASLRGDVMTLVSGKATYALKRQAQPLGNDAPNPLAPGAPAAQPAQDKTAAEDAPAGYTVIQATTAGKALVTEKPVQKNVQQALIATVSDLGVYLGAKPTITGAYEDSRDHRSAIASFSATWKGRPVRGCISAQVGERSARVAVIFCDANATPADWTKLTTPPPAPPARPGDAPAPPAAAPQQIRLTEYRFPDGTGVVGLADGWKTNAPSCATTFDIDGPGDQKISFGVTYTVNTPNSTAVQLARQYPVPGAVMLVAPYCAPADAIKYLVPQISAISQRNGGPAFEVDHLAKVQDLQPMMPNSKFELLSYGVTKSMRGQRRHYQAMTQVSVCPISNESWMVWCTQAMAPDETAKQDYPAIFAMVGSWKCNDQAIQQKTNVAIADSNRRFAAQQEAHKQLVATYDRYNESQRQNSIIRSRSVDNFDEMIRGYRAVEDTRTGERHDVDLGKVDAVVDHLNQYDPGRYKQIPLRDIADPLPGR